MKFFKKRENIISNNGKMRQYGISVSVSHLNKKYDATTIIKDMNFSVSAGESLALIGPSGCGKSTLLYLLSGLDTVYGGTIWYGAQENFLEQNIELEQKSILESDSFIIHGKEKESFKNASCAQFSPFRRSTTVVHESVSFLEKFGRKPRISYVMQDYGLFPWKNAEENLILPLMLLDTPINTQKIAVAEMLYELGLEGINSRYPNELSGGQRQRLALGRALISSPEILLLDEPLSSVDAITREHLQILLLHLWKKHAFTCILVTHSVSEALYLGKKIMVMGKNKDQNLENSQLVTTFENPCFGEDAMKHSNEYIKINQRISQELAKSY